MDPSQRVLRQGRIRDPADRRLRASALAVPYARAYRAALAEAGHVCQTFCLTATWLGLAPFCLMGLADDEIERDLGIDGITESVLYAAGAGVRPHGVTWAPTTRGSLKVRPNPAFRKR